MGPLVYIMSDTKPWGRYIPMFTGLFMRSMVDDVVRDLRSSPPDIVVMRSRELRQPTTTTCGSIATYGRTGLHTG